MTLRTLSLSSRYLLYGSWALFISHAIFQWFTVYINFLQNLYAPDSDPEMEITHYVRNHDQNETLGLNEMKTENYQNDSL